MTEPSPQTAPRPSPELRRVAFHAVASGLTPLIPVPLLDDLALRRVRERMVRDLLRYHGLEAPSQAVTTLAGPHHPLAIGGRALGALRSVALFPMKKIFRKVLFVLQLVAALWKERGYFKALAQRYDAHYALRP